MNSRLQQSSKTTMMIFKCCHSCEGRNLHVICPINVKIPHQVRDDKPIGIECLIGKYALGYSFTQTLIDKLMLGGAEASDFPNTQ